MYSRPIIRKVTLKFKTISQNHISSLAVVNNLYVYLSIIVRVFLYADIY